MFVPVLMTKVKSSATALLINGGVHVHNLCQTEIGFLSFHWGHHREIWKPVSASKKKKKKMKT